MLVLSTVPRGGGGRAEKICKGREERERRLQDGGAEFSVMKQDNNSKHEASTRATFFFH